MSFRDYESVPWQGGQEAEWGRKMKGGRKKGKTKGGQMSRVSQELGIQQLVIRVSVYRLCMQCDVYKNEIIYRQTQCS